MVILTKPAMAWDSFTCVPADHDNSLWSMAPPTYTIVPLLSCGDSEEEPLLSDLGFCPCHDFWLQIQNKDYKINKLVHISSKIKSENEKGINMWFQTLLSTSCRLFNCELDNRTALFCVLPKDEWSSCTLN